MQPAEGIDVLLIGESPTSFSHIIERLEKAGCRCRFADSYAQARLLLLEKTCELVLSVIPPRENAISSLAGLLTGTRASIYYAQQVEDGCWWLPAMRSGRRCSGTPALRPSEFAGALGQMVEEIRAGGQPEPEPVVRMIVLPEEPRKRKPVGAAFKIRSKAAS